MKKDIHPKWYPDAKVICACGHTFTIGSTKQELHVEVCSACHPLFTGQMRYVDTMGRVEKFMAKRKLATAKAVTAKTRKKRKREKERPETLKEMLKGK